MAKQIMFDDSARHKVVEGVKKLAKVVRVTLGPAGKNVILEKSFGGPQVTRDGVTVAKEKPQRGKVTAVGDGTRTKNGTRIKPDVKKGDTVLFGKYAGTDIQIDGDEYKIVRENEILAKLGSCPAPSSRPAPQPTACPSASRPRAGSSTITPASSSPA